MKELWRCPLTLLESLRCNPKKGHRDRAPRGRRSTSLLRAKGGPNSYYPAPGLEQCCSAVVAGQQRVHKSIVLLLSLLPYCTLRRSLFTVCTSCWRITARSGSIKSCRCCSRSPHLPPVHRLPALATPTSRSIQTAKPEIFQININNNKTPPLLYQIADGMVRSDQIRLLGQDEHFYAKSKRSLHGRTMCAPVLVTKIMCMSGCTHACSVLCALCHLFIINNRCTA